MTTYVICVVKLNNCKRQLAHTMITCICTVESLSLTLDQCENFAAKFGGCTFIAYVYLSILLHDH